MDCGISSNKDCLSASLWHGYFCFKRLRVVSFRGNMPFSMLFERWFMALLILPSFMCSPNFLDSCTIDFGLVESFSPVWIVSASLSSCNKSPDCHRIILHRSASEWYFAFELQLIFCNMRDGITIIALNIICFIAKSVSMHLIMVWFHLYNLSLLDLWEPWISFSSSIQLCHILRLIFFQKHDHRSHPM